MIEIKNITFTYENADQPALREISLNIRAGEWLAVIGANGSGKSTLARQINGLLLPESGEVTVDGMSTQDAAGLWQIRTQVAFVFQNPDNQIVATTVEEDIAFGLENIGLPSEKIEERVNYALDITGLQELRTKEPHLLSGGEKQRVAIAGALAMNSCYLVLDEPTSMLDPSLRRQVIETLQYMHKELGMTIIYITNIMDEAILAERIVVLSAGKLIKEGSPQDIFADHKWLQGQGLDMPQICRLGSMLSDGGFGSEYRGILHLEEMVATLVASH
jgi:energy-coupling factor transport system ATP-binding protein